MKIASRHRRLMQSTLLQCILAMTLEGTRSKSVSKCLVTFCPRTRFDCIVSAVMIYPKKMNYMLLNIFM